LCAFNQIFFVYAAHKSAAFGCRIAASLTPPNYTTDPDLYETYGNTTSYYYVHT